MDAPIALFGGTAVLPDREVPDALVVLEGGRILYAGERAAGEIPPGAQRIDARGGYILPGLIDTHVHGSHGDDVMRDGPEGIRRIATRFLRYGTTAWLPSTLSARHPELLRAVRAVAEARKAQGDAPDGAEILGIHVEGPYINPKRKGAQPEEGIRDPDFDEVRELLEAGEGLVRLVTLAPELPGGLELIRTLREAGIVASIGHTDATYEQAMAAVAAGATHATHLFNAMQPLHHRDPGVIAACLNRPEVAAELIPDGVHLHPETVRLAIRIKGPDASILITDAVPATGLPDGVHALGPHRIVVKGALCTLEDGTLAGSVLTMDRAVRNATAFAGVSLAEAVRMASLVPARIAGCAHRKGSLEPGKDADVALFDRAFRCRGTWVRGRLLYRDGDAAP